MLSSSIFAQKTVEDFGYTHKSIEYLGDTVDFIVSSKKGEKLKKKPILILIQGSLAKPLIKYNDDGGHFPPFSFQQGIFLDSFHLISIKKPGLPLISNVKELNRKGEFVDPITQERPKEFSDKNYLEYYVERNAEVIKFLLTQDWVDRTKIVVAGHSQGSSTALEMANKIPEITHLIYSGGGPYFGTIVDQLQQERKMDEAFDPHPEEILEQWKEIVNAPLNVSAGKGDTNRMWYSFSHSENEVFKRLKIPVLISYGTEDTSAPYNDLFHIEVIYNRITNITFNAYKGREHNYFKVKENGELDYEEKEFGWDRVGKDWLSWIMEN